VHIDIADKPKKLLYQLPRNFNEFRTAMVELSGLPIQVYPQGVSMQPHINHAMQNMQLKNSRIGIPFDKETFEQQWESIDENGYNGYLTISVRARGTCILSDSP
jgi:hypothetical protein